MFNFSMTSYIAVLAFTILQQLAVSLPFFIGAVMAQSRSNTWAKTALMAGASILLAASVIQMANFLMLRFFSASVYGYIQMGLGVFRIAGDITFAIGFIGFVLERPNRESDSSSDSNDA